MRFGTLAHSVRYNRRTMRLPSKPANRGSVQANRAPSGKPGRERRQNVRFPMKLPVRYNIAKTHGWGRIVNIGSGGALLTVDQPVKPGQRIELCIGWPVLLHEKVHLTLVAEGAVIRTEDGRAAVKFERCTFRTSNSAFRRQALLPDSPRVYSHG